MKKELKKSVQKEALKTYYALRGTCGGCGPCGCKGCPAPYSTATKTEYGNLVGYVESFGY